MPASQIHMSQHLVACPFALGEGSGRTVAVQLARVFEPTGPKVYYWAGGGQVCWWREPGTVRPPEPGEEPEYGVMHIWDAAERLNELVLMIITAPAHRNYHPEWRQRQSKFCEQMAIVIQEAKNQGLPGTDEAVKKWEADRPKLFVMPG